MRRDVNNRQETIRNRAKRRSYIYNGVRALFTNKLLCVFTLVLSITIFIVLWRVPEILVPHITSDFLSAFIIVWALRFSFEITTLALLTEILFLLGRPQKAQEIEDDLSEAFRVAEKYRCPFLISCKKNKETNVREYVFWSRWIDLEQWNVPEKRKAILWALNVHSDKEFELGEKKYTVAIQAAAGIRPEEREIPQDPLFM